MISWCYVAAKNVNKARGVKANVKARDMQDQGQGHRPKAKDENAKVNFSNKCQS